MLLGLPHSDREAPSLWQVSSQCRLFCKFQVSANLFFLAPIVGQGVSAHRDFGECVRPYQVLGFCSDLRRPDSLQPSFLQMDTSGLARDGTAAAALLCLLCQDRSDETRLPRAPKTRLHHHGSKATFHKFKVGSGFLAWQSLCRPVAEAHR